MRHLGEGGSPVSRGSALGLEASLSGVSRVPGRQGEGLGPCSPCSVPHWLLGDGLAVEAGLVSVPPSGLSHVLCVSLDLGLLPGAGRADREEPEAELGEGTQPLGGCKAA